MVKIGIIGATGTAGSAIFKEAQKRGHQVIALVRNVEKAYEMLGEDIEIIESGAFLLKEEQLKNFDVIVNAFATTPETAYLHVDLTAKLVHFFREEDKTRLFFILGAGSLLDENEDLYLDSLRKIPESEHFIAISENQYKQLKFLRDVDNVNWVGISPGETFQAGSAKDPILGKNHLLRNNQGQSITSSGTLARVIIDEIESPQFIQERFTAIDE